MGTTGTTSPKFRIYFSKTNDFVKNMQLKSKLSVFTELDNVHFMRVELVQRYITNC